MANKKDAAKRLAETLFLYEDMDQDEIAALVGVVPKTITAWKKDGDWDGKKNAMSSTRTAVIKSLYQQLKKIQDRFDSKDYVMSSKDADVVVKITTAINRIDKRVSLPLVLEVFKQFNSFCIVLDVDFTKKLLEFEKKFYQTKNLNEQ